MSEDKEYESTSLPTYLKDELRAKKGANETYADVIRRALGALSEKEDRQQSRWEWQNERMNEQSRLLVRMADEMGLDPGQIPGHMAEAEAMGKTETLEDIFAPPQEDVSDVNSAAKRARWQAEEEILDQDEGGERPEGVPDRAMTAHGEETEQQIQERAAEILAASDEPDEGYTSSFADSDNNEGDH